MRSGCGCGCGTVILLGLLVGVVLWLGSGIFERPTIRHEIGSPADGRRAQQKLFELTTRGPARERRAAATLTEPELNALLSRHVPGEQLRLDEMGVRLVGDGVVEVTGRLPLRALWGDRLDGAARLLPERWVAMPVWVRLRGPVRLELGADRGQRRTLRLDVAYLSIGRRRLPTALLGLFPEGPILRTTRWPVPDAVEAVTVEPGRVTIATRP
jgi:hypothetical protein